MCKRGRPGWSRAPLTRRLLQAKAITLATALATAGGLAAAAFAPAAVQAASVPARTPRLQARIPGLHWRPCDGGFQCTTAHVPLSYQQPRGRLISIAVIRHLAADRSRRTHSLFVNGGGPAAQIASFVALYPSIPAQLRSRFTIITFDPRGFGFSTQLRCFPSLAAENKLLAPVQPYPTFPVGARQTAMFERTYARFDEQCARHGGGLVQHDSTADVARDMNLIRAAVRSRRLDYIGLSYGTGLGAVYANLFPATVGHMVLDGNLDPIAWTHGDGEPEFVRQGNGPNQAAQNAEFLTLCGKRPTLKCAFSAGSAAATRKKFAELLKRLLAHPVVVDGQTVTYADVFQIVPPIDVSAWQPAAAQLQQLWIATTKVTSSTATRPTRITGFAAAGAPYAGLEQAMAVLCADSDDPHSAGAYVAAAMAGGTRYGGFGELAAWEDEACADWPRAAGQDRYSGPWNRWTASPILVVGNTGDPVTAYRNAVAMARDLRRARLLTVHGFGHTEFFNPSTCANNFVFRYLLTGAVPPSGTVCQQTVHPFPR
jgi:pimeloyl-ACP methyl ester carboxylesterase